MATKIPPRRKIMDKDLRRILLITADAYMDLNNRANHVDTKKTRGLIEAAVKALGKLHLDITTGGH